MPMPKTIPTPKVASPFAAMTGDHVAVRVPDFDQAVAWYVDKLDFRVVHTWPYGDLKLAYVTPPADDSFRIEILAGEGAQPKAAWTDLADSLNYAGWHHLCLRVESVDDTVAELRRRGVTIVAEPFELEDISRRLAFFCDPWGNLFELAQRLD